jgi:hypothetical protein
MEQLLAKLKQKIVEVEKTIEKTTGLRPITSVGAAAPAAAAATGDSVSVKTFVCSPFRHYPFRIKRRLKIPLVAKLAGQVVSYATLCQFVRDYLLANRIPVVYGSVFKCDPLLSAICGKDEASFFEIVRNFRSIVV